MTSIRIALALFAFGILSSQNAMAQCYAKADSCGTGYIAVPAPECEPSAHYACHPDPNYTPPAGFVTSMTLSPNPVAANGTFAIHTTGQNKCTFAFTMTDPNGKTIFSGTPTYGAAGGTHGINLGNLGWLNAGNYVVSLISPGGKNTCLQVPPPATINLFTPPVALSDNLLAIHSKDPAHFNSPFPIGAQLNYTYSPIASYPSCLVDVTVTGPENLNLPKQLIEFPKSYDLNLSKAGKYTLTFTTSASATGSQKCTGGPISKSFEIFQEASKFQNLQTPVIQPVQPAIKLKH